MEEENYYRYKVTLKSVPRMYEQYNGSVEVYASSPQQAIENALDKLRRGAFPDRSRNMWKIEKVELNF